MKTPSHTARDAQRSEHGAKPEQSAVALLRMIDDSAEEVLIAVGAFGSELLESGRTRQAMADAAQRGVSIRLLLPVEHEFADSEDLRRLGVSVFLSRKRLPAGFAVVDGRHVWYRSRGFAGSVQPAHKLVENAPLSAARLRRLFDAALGERVDS